MLCHAVRGRRDELACSAEFDLLEVGGNGKEGGVVCGCRWRQARPSDWKMPLVALTSLGCQDKRERLLKASGPVGLAC